MDLFTAAAATALGLGMGAVGGVVWGVPMLGIILGGALGAGIGVVLGLEWRDPSPGHRGSVQKSD